MISAAFASLLFAPPVAAHALPVPPAAAPKGQTSVAERVVTIAALDKDSSETKLFSLKPGEAVTFGKIRVVVRTCETAPPWERPHTGAFVQIDSAIKDRTPERLFSGWLFAESPSLNSFDHPRYDVWVKSCAMRFPETGPDTLVVGKSDSKAASSAPKSASETPIAPPSN